MKYSRGFTIVELLIVIVVIAILAAISVAAYINISDRANDTAIKSDLASLARKIKLLHVDKGEYPAGGVVVATDSSTTGTVVGGPEGLSFSPSKSAYFGTELRSGGYANLVYCTGPSATGGQPVFAVMAESKSGASFKYSSVSGLQSTGTYSPSNIRTCSEMTEPMSYSYGFFANSGGWQGWLN